MTKTLAPRPGPAASRRSSAATAARPGGGSERRPVAVDRRRPRPVPAPQVPRVVAAGSAPTARPHRSRSAAVLGGLALLVVVVCAGLAARLDDLAPWSLLLVLVVFVGASVPLLDARSRPGQDAHVTELALVLGLCLVPPSALVLLAAAGLVLAHLRHRRLAPAHRLEAATLVLGVALAGGLAHLSGLRPEEALTVRGVAALVVGPLLLALASRAVTARAAAAPDVTFLEAWGSGLPVRLGVAVAGATVGLLLVGMLQVDGALLVLVPPLLVTLSVLHRSYLRAMQERDVWQQLEQAGRELNHLDAREVGEAVVTRAALLMKAERVDLVVEPARPGDAPTTWSGDAHGLRSGPPPVRADDGGTGEMVHSVPLTGAQGRLGVLRVAFRGPVALTRRERHVLRTFCHSVSSALQNVLLYEQMRDHAEAKAHEAAHDGLTGLGNRTLLHDTAKALLEGPSGGGSTALLLIDLDHFKEINDTLGHTAGDVFLQQVGARLQGAVREASAVCRLGGDEFAVLLTGLPSAEAADLVAARLLRVLAEPVVFDGLRLSVEGSLGVACHPEDASTFDELLQRADVALYQAKSSRGSFTHYRPDRDDSSVHRLALAAELRTALARDELVVHFQPQFDVGTGEATGAEALVRWQHPTRGLLSPDAFVSTVEHSGLLRDFTLAVLEKAVDECAVWNRAGRALTVAVNLSARNLLDRELPADVVRVLARAGLAPERLVLEITETTMMSELDVVEEVLGRLRAAGVQLSVDDFGTGYSSLAFLQRVQVNEVKVDRSFVLGISTSESDRALVRATVQLAHSLGARAVGEGVEDEDLLRELIALGCDSAQGYHLGRPLPAGELRRALGLAPARRLRAVVPA